MTMHKLQYGADSRPDTTVESPERRTAASERELRTLREALAREEDLLRQKDGLIRQQETLNKESDHRLLNGLQLVQSLLWLQSGKSANAETASQLAVAASRVAAVGRIHRHLHSLDGAQTVTFKQYLKELCRDFSMMSCTSERVIDVEGIEVVLPPATGIPLGYIVNELITNAIKYGKGRITIRLESDPPKGYALSVSNDGPTLPERFDPAACKGLGMMIVRSLVERIGGQLRFGRGDNNEGARFTVLFSD